MAEFDPPNRLQNSRRALAIAELARDAGKLEAYRRAALDAHWRLGRNLEDDADLRAIAEQSGLDPDAVIDASSSPSYLDRVDARQADARARGIRGIPTFILGREAIQGCQQYPVLAAAAERAGIARRSR